MIKRLFLVLTLVGMGWSQTGFDILSTPTDARDASLGLTLNPTVKPTRILTHPETTVTLSVWNWVADIQGAYMGIALNNVHLSFHSQVSNLMQMVTVLPVHPVTILQVLQVH
jgi:hypothetical protein